MADRDPTLPNGVEALTQLPLESSYMRSPFSLLWSDIRLVLSRILYIPGTILPLKPYGSGPLCELYPSPANLREILGQMFLVVWQLSFILFMLFGVFFLVGALVVFCVLGFLLVNYIICIILLNGRKRTLTSNINMSQFPKHDDEKWIFVNGVAVG